MNRLRIDITGQRYERLLVIEAHWRGHRKLWRCKCDCGNETLSSYTSLRSGDARSCGCLRRENLQKRMDAEVTHGMSNTKIYRIWAGMVARCTIPTASGYRHYGGRGIKVCDRWLHSFENFFADMGEFKEGMSLDRIDVNGDYAPENCRWIPKSAQGWNTRRSVANKPPGSPVTRYQRFYYPKKLAKRIAALGGEK